MNDPSDTTAPLITNDFILLIINCKKYRDKAVLQKTTWLRNIPSRVVYYHIIGDRLSSEYKFDHENHILWVNTPDDYNSLPKKMVAALNAVRQTFSFKYVFKTDDDQTLIKPNFFNILINLLTANNINNVNNNTNSIQYHYGGYIVDVRQPHISTYWRFHPELPTNLRVLPTKYCSGRFYFLSHEAVDCIQRKRVKINAEFLEDYAIGYHLDDVYKRTPLAIRTNDFFTDIN